MTTQKLADRIVSDLYRARLFGQDESSVVKKELDTILENEFDKRESIIAYMLSFIPEKDLQVVKAGITEIEKKW